MKKTLTLAAVILLAGAVALPAIAFGQTGKVGNRKNRTGTSQRSETIKKNRDLNLTTEQREALETLKKDFYDETLSLRNDLRTKRTELTNIMSEKEPDEKKAKAVQEEISELQAELAQKQIERRLKVLEINPDAHYSKGSGRRMMMRGGTGMGGHTENDSSGGDTADI
jgi:Spy/CpxP family protein refolding chaperone